MFRTLRSYGYPVQPVPYIPWRTTLMDHTLTSQDNALYPLLHFVMDDLPTSTKGPELDDANTFRVTGGLDCGDMGELLGLYLGYLVEVGFLERPPVSATAAAQTNGNGLAVPEGQPARARSASRSVSDWFAAADLERKEIPKVELSAEMRKLVARNRD